MIEEIDLGGIKVPAADWESTPESIKLVLMFLLEERKQMKEKIEELEEKLNKNSRNSSIPPSKNGFVANVKSWTVRSFQLYFHTTNGIIRELVAVGHCFEIVGT